MQKSLIALGHFEEKLAHMRSQVQNRCVVLVIFDAIEIAWYFHVSADQK
jgi:hypothetical protein